MKIIVSLTSYPDRIRTLSRVIKTLMVQTRRPDLIILWLAEEQFANRDEDLPGDLIELTNYGLTIRWCKDLKPHKKYFYVMQEYPEDIVITVDDDVYYSPRMISVLMDEYDKHRNSVICIRANRIAKPEQGKFDYTEFETYYRGLCGIELTDILPTGVGGVLYPPHSIPKDAFDEDLIRKLCLYQDDIWLKTWSVINGFTNVIAVEELPLDIIKELQSDCLFIKNQKAGNDGALENIVQYLDNTFRKGIFEEKIFSSGKSINEYWNNIGIEEQELFIDLKQTLTSGKLYIYGAGQNAGMITEMLNKIKVYPYKYLVFNPKENPKRFEGVEVVGINEEKVPIEPYFVIISPAEKNHKKIIQDLKERGWNNFLFTEDEWMGEFQKGKKLIEKAMRNIALSYLKMEKKTISEEKT